MTTDFEPILQEKEGGEVSINGSTY